MLSLLRLSWIALIQLLVAITLHTGTLSAAESPDSGASETEKETEPDASSPAVRTKGSKRNKSQANDKTDKKEEAKESAPAPKKNVWNWPLKDVITYDWLRMKSGEWLKGELKSFRDDVIEFESDEFGDQVLDLDDVADLYTHGSVTVTLPDRAQYRGRISMIGETITVHEAEQKFDRSFIASAIPDNEWRDRWENKLGLGMTMRSGNVDQLDFTTDISSMYRSPFNRVSLSYAALYSEVSGEEIANNHRANGKWDYFMTDRWFVTIMEGEYYNDPYQNIDYRYTPSVGLGYSVINTRAVEWDVTTGLGYSYTKYVSVQPSEKNYNEAGQLLVGTTLRWELNKNTDWNIDFQQYIDLEDVDRSTHQFSTTISVDIGSDLDLDVTWAWDHIGQAQTDATNETPEEDDYRLVVGVSYDW